MLALPDFKETFVLECDTSRRGLGAVLMQNKWPIAYYSKPISIALLVKSTYEKELMALVLSIHYLRPYLIGQHFTIHIDQRSL